jgi:hypothetical protein
MGTFKNIREGWGNYIKAVQASAELPPEIKELADKRAEICGECDKLEESGFFKFVNRLIPGERPEDPKKVVSTRFAVSAETASKTPDVHKGYKCGECGCAFPANTYAPDKKCPLGKW